MADSIGSVYPASIPDYEDSADIKAALRLYHYGSETAPVSEAGVAAESVAGYLIDLQDQIDVLDSQTAIEPTIVDAKGDLIVGSASDTVDNLAVGTNNQILIADSAATLGVKWGDATSVVSLGSTSAAGKLQLTDSTSSTSTTTAATPNSVKAAYDLANGAVQTSSVNANLITFFATPSSANLASAVSDETGSGALVFGTSPSITTATMTRPVFISPQERFNISATAATSTINFNALTSAVLYYTSNASGNFVINLRGDGSTTLNSLMTTGDAMTVVFLNTNGGTAYYNTSVQIDGTTSGVTTKWQGGTAPSSGNTSSIDSYSYTVIKTANATFTVLASQTKFA